MTNYSPFDDLDDDYTHVPWAMGVSRQDYLEATGGDRAEAQRWYMCGFTPLDVRRFTAMGLSPEEAQSWGLNARMVTRFRALGFTKRDAREWALAGIWPDHAVHWRNRGFTSQMARAIIEHSDSPSAALAWTLVASDPCHLVNRARCGDKPGPILAEQAGRGATKAKG